MNGDIFRWFGVGLVFAAGIGSILATSAPPPPFHFDETNIRPAWRCPGADVEISWTLSQPAPVKVMVGGKEQVITTTGGTTLPAELLEHNAPDTTVILHIEAEDSQSPRSYEIATLDSERIVEELAFHARGDQFKMDPGGVWDERIHVVGIEVEQVRNLACKGGAIAPPAWEVSPPSGAPFILRAETGYSHRLDPALPPGGVWRLRPSGAECRLPSSGMQPYLSVRLTAVCSRGA